MKKIPKMKFITTEDGSHSLISNVHGDAYHSKYGAIQESKHVFIEAGLKASIGDKNSLHLLEIGFGTGLNAFLSFLHIQNTRLNLHYTSVEAYPIDLQTAKQLNYCKLLDAEHFHVDFMQLHEAEWGKNVSISEQFSLYKIKGNFEDFECPNQVDLIYFDAFAPNTQAELWTEEIFRKMYDLLNPNGILVTYCAKGVVKRAMKSAGFVVEGIPGPPGKREMTRAMKN